MLSMTRTPAGAAFTALILEVFRLNGRLLHAGDALTRPLRQSSSRWQVLGALDEQTRTVAEIGRQMGLTRQSVQRTADLLQADGLLSYSDNPAHRRAKLAMLTPRGRATLDAMSRRQIEWANELAAQVAESDLRRARRTLEQVRAAVDGSPASRQRHKTSTRSRTVSRPTSIRTTRRSRA
jgi:DNA-binding MarR family transcriptional regulator